MAFGPVMVVWFTMLLVVGIAEVMKYPAILKALNPQYAYQLLLQYPSGFWLLGAVFLATTGAEALYSDLGHCGRKNIRITWPFVKLSLMANYMGQAAWALNDGGTLLNGRNPFFEMMPGWFLIPAIIIATAAAIIASQALISGSYTLISEAASSLLATGSIFINNRSKDRLHSKRKHKLDGGVLMVYFRNSAHRKRIWIQSQLP